MCGERSPGADWKERLRGNFHEGTFLKNTTNGGFNEPRVPAGNWEHVHRGEWLQPSNWCPGFQLINLQNLCGLGDPQVTCPAGVSLNF